jgi:hypothetical protein
MAGSARDDRMDRLSARHSTQHPRRLHRGGTCSHRVEYLLAATCRKATAERVQASGGRQPRAVTAERVSNCATSPGAPGLVILWLASPRPDHSSTRHSRAELALTKVGAGTQILSPLPVLRERARVRVLQRKLRPEGSPQRQPTDAALGADATQTI